MSAWRVGRGSIIMPARQKTLTSLVNAVHARGVGLEHQTGSPRTLAHTFADYCGRVTKEGNVSDDKERRKTPYPKEVRVVYMPLHVISKKIRGSRIASCTNKERKQKFLMKHEQSTLQAVNDH